MKRALLTLALVLISIVTAMAAYKFKPLPVKAAGEYPAKQEFQKLVIAAEPFGSEERLMTIFDRKDIYKSGFIAVLVVIQNDNDFPVEISDREIYLVTSEDNRRAIPAEDVAIRVLHGRSLEEIGKRKGVLRGQIKNQDLTEDLEKKAFDTKIIAPFTSEHGLVFFRHDHSPDFLKDAKLYLPKIYNMRTTEEMIFFEFEVLPSGGKVK